MKSVADTNQRRSIKRVVVFVRPINLDMPLGVM
jgi:hypothetical protein